MNWIPIAIEIVRIIPTLVKLIGLADKSVEDQEGVLYRKPEDKRKEVRKKLDNSTLINGIKASGPLKNAAIELALTRKRRRKLK